MNWVQFWTVITLFYLTSASAEQSDISEQSKQATKAQLNHLQKKIRQISGDIALKQEKYSNVTAALKKNEKEINTVAKNLRQTRKELRRSRDNLMKMRAEKKLLDVKKEKHIGILFEQIKTAYVNGSQAYLKLLLNQKNPATIGRNIVYYRYLNQARIDSVTELKETIAALIEIEKNITQEVAQLGNLKRKQEKREKSLIKQKRERRKLVQLLQQEINAQGKQLGNLKENEKEVMAILAAINEAINQAPELTMEGLQELKGKLQWPLTGKLQNRFGDERDEGKLKWKGVVITAPEGKDVRAIYHGRVMYADWLRGFGLLAVVDHGNGYVSLYGHNQSLYKEAGDWVESGELISTVGQSGGNEQSGLYFEIRKGAKPLNPSQWCSKG